jgi:adenylate cyclase class IV
MDTFLPARSQGEMVRVRRETRTHSTRVVLAHKRWVTARNSREREETEERIGELTATMLVELGQQIQGGSLLSFSKNRRIFVGKIAGLSAQVVIDDARGLGDFSGNYLEVETIMPLGADFLEARNNIVIFAQNLLGQDYQPVEYSYFDMLKLSLK